MYKVEAAIFQPWVQGSREAMRQLAKDEDYVRIALLQDERGQRGAMEELLHALSKKVGDYVLDAAQQKRQVRQARSLVQEEQVERDYLLEAQAHRRAVLEQVVIKEAVTRVCLERCEANDCAALDLGNGRAFLLHLLEAQEEFLARVSAEETRKREALLTYERDARRHRHDCYIGERYEIRRRASSAHKATYMSGGRDPSGRRPMAVGLTPAAPVPRPSYFASPDSAAYNRQAAFTQRWKEGASTFMSRCPSASPQRARTPAFQPTPPRPDHRPASAQRARGKYGFSPRTPERPQSARAPPHDAFASASPQRAIPPPAIPDSSVEETVGHESSLDSSVKDSTASPCRRGSPAGEGKDEKEDAWQLVELNHDDAIVLLRGDNRGRDGILSSQKEAHADLMLAFRCEELQLLSARHKRPVYKTAEEDDHAADQARKLSAREYAQQVRDELQALETGAPAPPPSARPGSARPRPEAAAKPATAHDLNRHTSEDEAGMRHFMARRIQRSLRRYCAEKPRRDLAVYNAHRVADENDQDAKACAMQRAARGYIARKETGRRRSSTHEHVAQAIKEDKHRDESACTIQRAYRGAAAREKRQSLAEAVDSSNVTRRASEQSPAEATDEDDDTKAATKIQAVQRGRQARRETEAKKEALAEEKQRAEAATKIQAAQRGRQARRESEAKKEALAEEKQRAEAATKIQAAQRGRQARRESEAKKEAAAEEERKRAEAATKIQAAQRGRQGRRASAMRQQEAAEAAEAAEKEEEEQRRAEAATKIQVMQRGRQQARQVSVAEEAFAAAPLETKKGDGVEMMRRSSRSGSVSADALQKAMQEKEKNDGGRETLRRLSRAGSAAADAMEKALDSPTAETKQGTGRSSGADGGSAADAIDTATQERERGPAERGDGVEMLRRSSRAGSVSADAMEKAMQEPAPPKKEEPVRLGAHVKQLLECVQALLDSGKAGLREDDGISLLLHPTFQ